MLAIIPSDAQVTWGMGFYSTGWSLFSVTEARLVTSFTCWPLHTSPLLLLATQIWAMSTSACLSENPQRVFNLLQGTGDKSWGRAQCSQSTARSCGDGDTSQCCHPHASPPDFRDEGQTQLQEVGQQGQGTQGGAGRPHHLLFPGSTDLWVRPASQQRPMRGRWCKAMSEVRHIRQLPLPKALMGGSSCAEAP